MDLTVGTALRIADQVLAGATGDVRDPVAYVIGAVRKNPLKYRPAPEHPPVAQVLADMRRPAT